MLYILYTTTNLTIHIQLICIIIGNHKQGYIDSESLARSISTYSNEKITIDQARDLVSQLEVNDEGLINYQAFLDMLST